MDLEGWEESGYAEGVGEARAFRAGAAEGKGRRASVKPRRMPAGEWRFKGVEGSGEARRAPGSEDISVHRVGTHDGAQRGQRAERCLLGRSL